MNLVKQKLIDLEIDRVLTLMSKMKPESAEYTAAAVNLDKLHSARSFKKEWSVSTDTIIIAATAIFQTLMILNHEYVGVVSSKALAYVLKGKIG